MNFWKRIMWLLFDAPINVTNKLSEYSRCDYCGSTEQQLFEFRNFTVCRDCLKTALDKVLK